MVQLTNLRLSGFKSFVDPTDLVIESGLTGVVGPNGCGKSNLVEALRWVMGENSAKRMRGSEMDDVIFAGTSNRPSRNLADVVITLDNRDRSAPAAYNDSEQIEISRKISRGQGSSYRINGKEARARDVQLLFADLASGSHSTAMVSQGRVGALINAKPSGRRALLEEAAGISGLYTRRHEAELRLRAAETNLERLEDVVATLDTQLQGLKKQARQASRYKNVNAQIRQLEAIVLHIEYLAARDEIAAAERSFEASERLVGETGGKAAEAARAQAEIAAGLPELRQREAEAAAALQRLLIDRDSLRRDAERAAAQKTQVEERRAQIMADRARVERTLLDADEAQERLKAESNSLVEQEEAEKERREAAKRELGDARNQRDEKERAVSDLSQRLAADDARARALEKQIQSLESRIGRLREEARLAAAKRSDLEKTLAEQTGQGGAEEAVNHAEKALEAARSIAETTAEALAGLREQEEAAREAARERERDFSTVQAEADALAALLKSSESEDWPEIVDTLNVKAGFETALGAALGDDLSASSDEAAPIHWETLPELTAVPSLPEGAVPLSKWVKGPQALARRLSQIGVVADESVAIELQPRLLPGQRLVTRKGGLWRWDGLAAKADAPTAAAVRLEQRNRLAELQDLLEVKRREHEQEKEVWERVLGELNAAQQREREARESVNRCFSDLDRCRRALSEEMQRLANLKSQAERGKENEERLQRELEETSGSLAQLQQEMGSLPSLEEARRRLQSLSEELQAKRRAVADCQARLSAFERDAANRGQRLLSIGNEAKSWAQRAEDAQQHLAELDGRDKAVREELSLLEDLPQEIEEKLEKLSELIETAEQKRKSAADDLAEAENLQRFADQALKSAESALQQAREDRVRAEAGREHAIEALAALKSKVMEKLGCEFDEILDFADIEPGTELPSRNLLEDKLAKLLRERENIGPVNLRAEQEAEELAQQIEGLQSERRDLISAIGRLRQGIGALNSEGRERLLAAFEAVDAHFSELFVRLFGGGRAHLSLTDSDDPLEAGLEIMASPPGKRLQVMSLLSGGEQALTALALLFAVFLTNPAPICVLDEVDAPLDDANVDRLCTLLDEMVSNTSTRFLIITHHRMTMARADRLFGVTMAERGVSQLVSVDFDTAARLRETA